MHSDGTAIQRLTHDDKGAGHPRWSPDGEQIVFHSTRDGVQVTASAVELYLLTVDGGSIRRLTNNQLYDGFADW